MAILDNGGDIILDAVLTDIGRAKMGNGTFRIVKFSCGDDEIDYNLYDKNHRSGSAYYDLEILQTPVLEAFTNTNANINYGLLSYANPRLLYLPVMMRNDKIANTIVLPRNNVFYLANNGDGATYNNLVSAFGGANAGGDKYVLLAGSLNTRAIMLETGLDTAEIPGTQSNRAAYITAQGLVDNKFDISVDTRFFTAVLGPTSACVFNNNNGNGEVSIRCELIRTTPTFPDTNLRNHSIATVRGLSNNVVYRQDDTKADTASSNISGPRASALFLNFAIKQFNDNEFLRFGKTGQNLFGDGNTYSYIDTNVFVVGRSTGIMETIPIRIIKTD